MTVNREGVMAVRVISVLQLHIVVLDNWGTVIMKAKTQWLDCVFAVDMWFIVGDFCVYIG